MRSPSGVRGAGGKAGIETISSTPVRPSVDSTRCQGLEHRSRSQPRAGPARPGSHRAVSPTLRPLSTHRRSGACSGLPRVRPGTTPSRGAYLQPVPAAAEPARPVLWAGGHPRCHDGCSRRGRSQGILGERSRWSTRSAPGLPRQQRPPSGTRRRTLTPDRRPSASRRVAGIGSRRRRGGDHRRGRCGRSGTLALPCGRRSRPVRGGGVLTAGDPLPSHPLTADGLLPRRVRKFASSPTPPRRLPPPPGRRPPAMVRPPAAHRSGGPPARCRPGRRRPASRRGCTSSSS